MPSTERAIELVVPIDWVDVFADLRNLRGLGRAAASRRVDVFADLRAVTHVGRLDIDNTFVDARESDDLAITRSTRGVRRRNFDDIVRRVLPRSFARHTNRQREF